MRHLFVMRASDAGQGITPSQLFCSLCDLGNRQLIRIHLFSGLLPPLDPAEDSVSALHQESAVRHIAHQPEPVPVLPPQEVHLGRHEQRR